MNRSPTTVAERIQQAPETVREPQTAASAPDPHGARTPMLLDVATFLLRASEVVALAGSSLIVTAFLADRIGAGSIDNHVNAAFIAAVFYAGLAEITGGYDVDIRFSIRNSWARVATAWIATSMFMLTIGFLLKVSEEFSRGWAVSWFLIGGAALLGVRAVGTGWMRNLKRQGVFNQRVAIFGAGPQGDRLARYIMGNEKLTIELVGFFDDRMPGRLPPQEVDLPVRGTIVDLIELIRRGGVDQVIVALPWSAEARLQEVVAELAITPVRIRLAPDLASFAFAGRATVLLGDLPVMTLFERPISGFDQVTKRAEDLIFGTLCLLITAPVLILAAIAIKLDSPGPVFFRQEREGFNNRRFRIWKFRSMRVDHCDDDNIVQASRRDPRITRVGAILRRTSFDELPQLLNVMKGEMSLIGPRPHAPSTKAGDRLFSDVVATYAARHKVKPGITGWAQVCGWRGETDTEEKLLKRLEHDLFYIENWSVTFDLYILVRTAATFFFHRGAY